MLHVTNGDCAVDVLRRGGIAGEMLAWRDALHEGPVPRTPSEDELRATRARFLAEALWGREEATRADFEARDARLQQALDSGEEIVLWFELDLYDDLQRAQIVARLTSGAARIVLVGEEEFVGVGELDPAQTPPLLDAARPVRDAEIAQARALWDAFRDEDPRALTHRRLQEQFPWSTDSLTRSERALLQAVASGAATNVEAFLRAQRQEERPFLGDTIAFSYIDRMTSGEQPLIARNGRLTVTARGEAILEGAAAWDHRPPYWLGGARAHQWRWDAGAGRLQPA